MKRRSFMKTTAVAGAAATVAPAIWSEAKAQARNETLLLVTESPPNSMDIHGVGTNRPAYEVSWNTHDRLITYGVKKDANGNDHYDYTKLEPELATDWNVTPTSATFKLRKDAKFHDGTPITAKDVKWSFDRAVSVGGFPTFQMAAGSLEKKEQFVVVDDGTFRVDFLRADKLTMPDIGVPVPVIMNSELCKKNATATDPWAMEWCKNNLAAGGAYKVERWQPGQEVVFVRNDEWKNGPMPKVRRVIQRIIPSAGNRRALLERGDADISFDLPSKDFAELKTAPKLTVIGTPIENAMMYLGMNVNQKPFDNVKVRQAVAYALPYQKIMDAVLFGLAEPMYAAKAGAPLDVKALEEDLLYAYGEGRYSNLGYQLVRSEDKNMLRLYPTEKPWGPNFLRSGLNFAWGSREDARYNIRLAYQMTQLNRSGGELLLTGQLGADNLVGVNWYQPLETDRPWFTETSALLGSQSVDLYQDGRAQARLKTVLTEINTGLGLNLGRHGILKSGLLLRNQHASTSIGSKIALFI